MAQAKQGTSDSRTIFTILALIFLYPLGLILAWFWTRWPVGVKILVALPAIALISAVLLVSVSRPRTNNSSSSPGVTVTPSVQPK